MAYYEWNKNLHKVKQGKNWTYILEEEDDFSQLGYKVIQSSGPTGQEGLLRCAKIRYNGQIKLIYFTEDLQNLPTLLAALSTNSVWTVFYKLLNTIVKIQEYGFFSCENLDITPECIFFDPKTQEPYLIYIPLETTGSDENIPEFEAALCRSMVAALRSSNNALIQDRENALIEILSGSVGGLKGMQKEILKNINVEDGETGDLVLQCRKPSPPEIPHRFTVNKREYTIGRSVDNDGVIDKISISRHHCVIGKKNNSFYIVDKKSKYGTFLNGKPCFAGEEKILHDKDVVRLDKLEFDVRIQVK